MSEAQSTNTVEFRPIAGFPGYRVGKDGTVWSARTVEKLPGKHKGTRAAVSNTWKKLKATHYQKQYGTGYCVVVLYREGKRHTRLVHRLVLETFIGPRPEGKQARHFPDRDGRNNRLDNLQWGTPDENMNDQRVHGTANSLFTPDQVIDILTKYATGNYTQQELGDLFNTTQQTIYDVVSRRVYKNIPFVEPENAFKGDRSKLSPEQVRAIRKDKSELSYRQLAAKYNLPLAYVKKVVLGYLYKHVT